VTSLTGAGALIRMALRRDRVRLPVWILLITAMVLIVAVALEDLYPTVPSRLAIAATIAANPALQAMLGPIFDPTSIGGLVAWRMSFACLVLVPLMASFAVVRHTRAEEEAGRLELLGSTVLGRRAPLAAALAVACGASLVIGLAVALVLVSLGEATAGSVALGTTYALAGCTFAAIAAVAAQLTESSRGATGMTVGLLGASFLVRGVGDASVEGGWSTLSWASPLGWMLQVRPYAENRWWLLGILAAFAVAAVLVAERLVARRDLGAGLVPPRPGPGDAADWLDGPRGLAWRLQRGALLGWAVGLLVLGAMFGGVAGGVGQVLDQTPQLEEVFRQLGGEQVLIDAFFATTMALVGLLTAGYVIHATLRLRAEETGQRAEMVLSTAVTRTAWAASHVGIAVGGAVVLLASAALGAGLVHGARTGDVTGEVATLLAAAGVQLPAVLVLGGLTLAVVGLVPRATGLTWAALVAALLLGQLGPILQLDRWLMNLSPFTHVPALPGEALRLLPLVTLTAVAAALLAAGLVGLRTRDVG
jgi:ABC-2 type transport system permease protein